MKALIVLMMLAVAGGAQGQTMPMPIFCMPEAVAQAINKQQGWVAQESGRDGDEWVLYTQQSGDWALLLHIDSSKTACAIGAGTAWKGKKGV